MANIKNKSKTADSKFIFTRREIATIFDMNETVIDKWRKKGCPTVDGKKFDIRELMKWRKIDTGEFAVTEDESLSDLPVNEQYAYYKMKVAESDAQLKKFKVDLENGKYLPRDEIEHNISVCLDHFKKGLRAQHTKIISEIAPYISTEDKDKVMIKIEEINIDTLNRFAQGEIIKNEKKKVKV